MTVYATYNIKGGVGKTAAAVNLAYLSARDGHRTLLWDLDPQSAATYYFRIKPKVKGGGRKLVRGKSDLARRIRATDFEGLDLLPADFSYRNLDLYLDDQKKPERQLGRLLKPLRKEYDYIFLDCPPSISLVSESVFQAADALLVPMIPTTLSLRTSDQLRKHLSKRGPKKLAVFPFFCMVDRRKNLHKSICAAGSEMAYPALETVIPSSTVVEQMGVRRKPVLEFAARSQAADAFRQLWKEVQSRS